MQFWVKSLTTVILTGKDRRCRVIISEILPVDVMPSPESLFHAAYQTFSYLTSPHPILS